MAEVLTAPGPRSTGVAVARMRDLALLPGIALVMVVGAFSDKAFLTHGNLIDVLDNFAWISMLVLAEAVILISGKLDLSLESTVALAPAVAVWLTLPKAGRGIALLPAAWAIPITLAVGLLIGMVNALLIVRFQLSSFIVTLGMLITLRGIETGISKGQTFFGFSSSMLYLGATQWFGLPVGVWLSLVAFAIGIFVLSLTRPGRSLYAIGGNLNAARAAGIRVERVLWAVFILGSLLAAVGGLLYAGKYASIGADSGKGYIFTVFAATVLGGVSLNGGKGTLFGAFCGILLLYLVQNILTLVGVSGYWQDALNGAIILTVLIIARVTTGEAQA
ncbi:MAG: simple sugar transport system permease protein [Frankiales bacterium]|jgi:simple sugar transport system permease protein|nr:simple sugar transport system permease protein [Frankiales bacterium]MDX6213547.1 simple sugar transport system permease protein [Frankiales bacterium]MDX6223205.1 simple sugar transport system permease protein [Frankiales bacterium]